MRRQIPGEIVFNPYVTEIPSHWKYFKCIEGGLRVEVTVGGRVHKPVECYLQNFQNWLSQQDRIKPDEE